MNYLRYIIILFLLTNCSQSNEFCDCYHWRSYLIDQYQDENTKEEREKLEFEMGLFDQNCFRFQEYTSDIDSEYQLNIYFDFVEECE